MKPPRLFLWVSRATSCRPVRQILGVAILALNLVPLGSAQAIGFEQAEGFFEGADIVTAWKASVPGVGKITAAQARGGAQSLEISSGPEEAAALVLPLSVSPDGTVFIDFAVLPVADPSATPLSTVDANGAVLGFVKEGDRGTVVAVARSGASTATGSTFEVDAENLAADWLRVTIRQDAKARTWDLYLDGKLVLIDQKLDGVTGKTVPGAVALYASPAGSAFVDDLTVGEKTLSFPTRMRTAFPTPWKKPPAAIPTLRIARAAPARASPRTSRNF